MFPVEYVLPIGCYCVLVSLISCHTFCWRRKSRNSQDTGGSNSRSMLLTKLYSIIYTLLYGVLLVVSVTANGFLINSRPPQHVLAIKLEQLYKQQWTSDDRLEFQQQHQCCGFSSPTDFVEYDNRVCIKPSQYNPYDPPSLRHQQTCQSALYSIDDTLWIVIYVFIAVQCLVNSLCVFSFIYSLLHTRTLFGSQTSKYDMPADDADGEDEEDDDREDANLLQEWLQWNEQDLYQSVSSASNGYGGTRNKRLQIYS
ncbi:hypothetical protein MP228_008763 [Amoeboaphelidium protococcarum]|nr:hypothetical protein MP228_008763 [Amoeboaphelidium protococcarum]